MGPKQIVDSPVALDVPIEKQGQTLQDASVILGGIYKNQHENDRDVQNKLYKY